MGTFHAVIFTEIWVRIKNDDYISAIAGNAFAPSFLVELISRNCKKYCKKYCSCHSNGKNCTDMCGCGKFYQKTDPLSTQNNTWSGSPTWRGTLLIFNSHSEVFWKIAVFKKFADLQMSKHLRSPENYLQKLLVLLTEEWVSKELAHLLRTPIFRTY